MIISIVKKSKNINHAYNKNLPQIRNRRYLHQPDKEYLKGNIYITFNTK